MFKLTNFFAVNVEDVEKASHFYKDIMGFHLISGNKKESRLEKDGINLFFDEDKENQGVFFFEFETPNIESAVSLLLKNGCLIRQKLNEKSLLITDPFGINFHLYETGAELNSL